MINQHTSSKIVASGVADFTKLSFCNIIYIYVVQYDINLESLCVLLVTAYQSNTLHKTLGSSGNNVFINCKVQLSKSIFIPSSSVVSIGDTHANL